MAKYDGGTMESLMAIMSHHHPGRLIYERAIKKLVRSLHGHCSSMLMLLVLGVVESTSKSDYSLSCWIDHHLVLSIRVSFTWRRYVLRPFQLPDREVVGTNVRGIR